MVFAAGVNIPLSLRSCNRCLSITMAASAAHQTHLHPRPTCPCTGCQNPRGGCICAPWGSFCKGAMPRGQQCLPRWARTGTVGSPQVSGGAFHSAAETLLWRMASKISPVRDIQVYSCRNCRLLGFALLSHQILMSAISFASHFTGLRKVGPNRCDDLSSVPVVPGQSAFPTLFLSDCFPPPPSLHHQHFAGGIGPKTGLRLFPPHLDR